MSGGQEREGASAAAQSLLSIIMRENEAMGSSGLLSGIISLDHNRREAAHETQSERLNNGNPSKSRGPREFQRLIIAGCLKSPEKMLP